MKHGARLGLLAGSIVLAVHACDYPGFEFGSAEPLTTTTSLQGGGGAAGTGNNGGTGNTGQAGGHAGSGGHTGNAGGTDTGGDGGSGGEPPCEPRDLEACGEQKCSVVDESTGATGCGLAGPLEAWNVCSSDADCAAGLWCDHLTGVCKPVCDNVGDCPDPTSQCLPAQADGGGSIPGLSVCVANCNPMSPGCGPHANCVYLGNPPLFDCTASLDHADGDSCSVDSDCAAGMTCRGSNCELWCSTPGDTFSWCKPVVWCCSIDPAPYYDQTELGYCDCP
jgi:hypothetical protein